MRKLLAATIAFMTIWGAIIILALLWGFQYNWPDNVHTNYGIPLTWATHTTSTFAGPADLWSVNIGNLCFDLALWMGILIVVLALIQVMLNRKKPPKASPA
jgi:hypothetical protein